MYDPSLGRFMGIDPVGALEGVSQLNNPAMFNRYAYANNNPYKYVDPDGNAPIIPVVIFVVKEVAGEVFEQTTGVPAPTIKNAGKLAAKKVLKSEIKSGPKVGSTGGPGSKKRHIPNKVKEAELQRTDGNCVFCGKSTTSERGPSQLNFDHSVSVKNGGNNTLENIQTTCRTCNLQKGARNTDQFIKDLSKDEKLRSLDGKGK